MEKRELQCCLALGRAGEERGREEKSHPLPVAAEAWDDEMDPQPSTEWEDHRKTAGSPAQPSPLEPSSAVADQTWDSEAESKGSQTLFPEAFTDPATSEIPGLPIPGLPTASSAQPTALAATSLGSLPHPTTPGSLPHQTTPGYLPRQMTPGSLPHQTTAGFLPQRPTPSLSSSRLTAPVEFQTVASSVHSSRLHSRHKRLARSQIPSQPVEMPKGTYPEMSELGIAFGRLELQPQPTTTTSLSREPTSGPPSSSSSSQPQDGLLATPTSNEMRFQSDAVTTATLAYSTQFTEGSGVISIATTTNSYGGGLKKLEAPPGLPHPLTNPHTPTVVSSLAPSGSLPHSVVPSGHSVVPSGSLPHSVVPSGSLPHSVVPTGSLPHSAVSSGSLVVSGSSGSLPHTATLAHMVPLTTTGDSAVSTTRPLPSTTSGSKPGGSVGAMLPPETISLPPPPPPASLLTPIESASDHSKTTFTTAASTSQLLPQSFAATSSSGTTVGGASEHLLSQTTPTSSSVATPISKTLTAQSSHHHGNQQQLQTALQGGSKHNSLQQQQQAMIYPYMLQPPLVMPMSAYYDPEMSRYQAASAVSMAYYQHPTSSDPAMVTGMGRDHVGSGFTEGTGGGAGGGKFGGRAAEISTSVAPPHSQQQGVQQSQMGHAAAVFNPYYGGNVIYPMYHGYGMPGFSHSIPKPSGGFFVSGGWGQQLPDSVGGWV
ncbi:hypothetical protein GBAR_LOCUS17024 [Geodia barretti]|uniref:Uncharacterized protein n=2 Tax=Geodia barretti TaxID=519541 RepID=A0AA35WXA7_GEOBA|nr:hypothetical protein GBAR_LOCUS17024 [Geodia barretti]